MNDIEIEGLLCPLSQLITWGKHTCIMYYSTIIVLTTGRANKKYNNLCSRIFMSVLSDYKGVIVKPYSYYSLWY